MVITKQQILAFEKSYKAQFVNSLSGFKSVNLIGSIDVRGHTNLAIVSTVTHLGSNPALIGFVVRPSVKSRHTLENIVETQQFTINQVSGDIWQAAHQTSIHYPREVCEFDEVGLAREYHGDIKAPFVAESNLKYSLTLKEIITIESNSTQLIIGEVEDVILSSNVIKSDGYIDIETLHAVTISGVDSYHLTQRLSRISPTLDKNVESDSEDVPDWF